MSDGNIGNKKHKTSMATDERSRLSSLLLGEAVDLPNSGDPLADIAAAVQQHVSSKPVHDQLAWLVVAQGKLGQDTRQARARKPLNQACTKKCLGPAFAQLVRASEWGAALRTQCSTTAECAIPAELMGVAEPPPRPSPLFLRV